MSEIIINENLMPGDKGFQHQQRNTRRNLAKTESPYLENLRNQFESYYKMNDKDMYMVFSRLTNPDIVEWEKRQRMENGRKRSTIHDAIDYRQDDEYQVLPIIQRIKIVKNAISQNLHTMSGGTIKVSRSLDRYKT